MDDCATVEYFAAANGCTFVDYCVSADSHATLD